MYPTIVPYFLSSDQSYEKKILPSGAASAYVPAGGASVFALITVALVAHYPFRAFGLGGGVGRFNAFANFRASRQSWRSSFSVHRFLVAIDKILIKRKPPESVHRSNASRGPPLSSLGPCTAGRPSLPLCPSSRQGSPGGARTRQALGGVRWHQRPPGRCFLDRRSYQPLSGPTAAVWPPQLPAASLSLCRPQRRQSRLRAGSER